MPTKIPWSNETWPVVTGCYPCSTGCKNCYAARMAATRLRYHPRYEGLAVMYEGRPMWTGEIRLNHDVLEQPLHWRKPRMVFVASMGDWLHHDVPELFIYRILDITQRTSQHIYQFLTKRASRLPVIIKDWMLDRGLRKPPRNIWQGVSVENQAAANERILWLRRTPAAVRFVSAEPMLSAVNLRKWLYPKLNTLTGGTRFERLAWVICGGESGPSARPMDEDWVRDLRDQCVAAGTPFFYKQAVRNGRRVHMPELDGQVWDEFPASAPGQP